MKSPYCFEMIYTLQAIFINKKMPSNIKLFIPNI